VNSGESPVPADEIESYSRDYFTDIQDIINENKEIRKELEALNQVKHKSSESDRIRNTVQFALKQKKKKPKTHYHSTDKVTKYRKHKIKEQWKWEATITDISVRINMFCE